VPPDGVTVAVPVDPPKQNTFVWDVDNERAEAGSVNVTVAVSVHRFASVTVTVYVPAISPEAVWLV
jgi:hypothetical protein